MVVRVKCKSKWNGRVFVCTTNVNRLNYQPLFGNISPRSCPWSHFSREGAKTGHKKAAEVEPTMCKDEIECNGALSVTGGLEVLFADVRSLVFAVGGFSTPWQRLVWCFLGNTLSRYFDLHLDTGWFIKLQHALTLRTHSFPYLSQH